MEHSQFYGTNIILILKVDKDSIRKDHYRPFLFVNTCESENIKLNSAKYAKKIIKENFISGMQDWFHI